MKNVLLTQTNQRFTALEEWCVFDELADAIGGQAGEQNSMGRDHQSDHDRFDLVEKKASSALACCESVTPLIDCF
jgi:hypothetical protein